MGLLVPRSSRLAADRDEGGLRRQTVRVAVAFAVLAVVLVAVVVPVGRLVVRHIPKYADIAGLVLPIGIQAGIYLVQIPFAAAIRGMHRGRLLFVQYLIFSVTSLTGLVIGASSGHLAPAAWGLTTGAAVGLVVFVALYAWAAARLRSAAPDPGDAEPSSRNASPASR
jgi:O-antigen/teichoic acid export membrane protein